MTPTRWVLSGFAAFIVALGIGYAMGGSGRFTLQNALDDARGKLDLADARVQLLEARVSLYNVNFGDASRHFEEAKPPLRRVRERYQNIGKNAAAGQHRGGARAHRGRAASGGQARSGRQRESQRRARSDSRRVVAVARYFRIVAVSSTVILRSDVGSDACEITSGLPDSTSTESRSFSEPAAFAARGIFGAGLWRVLEAEVEPHQAVLDDCRAIASTFSVTLKRPLGVCDLPAAADAAVLPVRDDHAHGALRRLRRARPDR